MDASRSAVRGLFFTTLVKTQTNVDAPREAKDVCGVDRSNPEFDRLARREAYRRPPVTSVEQRFRHGGWLLERLRVQHALIAANVPASRRERFADCGSDCVVEYSPSRSRHRTRANYCGDRFCLPCARARAFRVRERLAKLIGDSRPLLITLTIRNLPRSLTDAINHLLRSFRRLRQHKLWRDHITAGAAFVEVKRGQNSGEWHPHLHIIAAGSYVPGERVSRAWFKATGDSSRIDIQRARSSEDGISYAGKYATKGWTAEVTRDHDSLVECILALRGRRLCSTFGDWHGVDVEDDDLGEQDWKRVGRLDHVYDRFLAGEVWAGAVILSLHNGCEERMILAPPLEPPGG